MYKDIIDKRRELFEKMDKSQDKVYEHLTYLFKAVNNQLSDDYKMLLSLRVFEFILYRWYCTKGRVVNKCEIDSELVQSRSKLAGKARLLLTALYSLRNSCAHYGLESVAYLKALCKRLRDIKQAELKVVMRLLPGNVPDSISNIVYIDKSLSNTN